MNDYVGMNVRSETMFYAAYKYVTDLQRYAQEQLKAENSHELMRCSDSRTDCPLQKALLHSSYYIDLLPDLENTIGIHKYQM